MNEEYKCDCQKCGKSMEMIASACCALDGDRIERWSCHDCKLTFDTVWECKEFYKHHKYETKQDIDELRKRNKKTNTNKLTS